MSKEKFIESLNAGYAFQGKSIVMGTAIFNGEPIPNTLIKIPLKSLTRHGLIAGATGTGKTKSLQVLAEQLSNNGIPSLVMDLKGDLSGLAQAGSNNKHVEWRHGMIGIPYEAGAKPVELLSLSSEKGVKLRATVSEFGPVLISKILDLNDTQAGIMAVTFKYCDDNKLPLLDLKDLKKVLQFAVGDGKEEFIENYGAMSSTSVNTIVRKVIELEQQGAEMFFGELSFDVKDLLKKSSDGKGIINIIRLTDIQDRPKLFSTFMLSLLAEVYSTFPEEGDMDQPKLCIFIDEAHLVFSTASKALSEQIEAIIKLIRSKGVGIFFVTQNPTDVPDAVLSQLGLKIQHALRAFTAKDRTEIKKTAQNYPISEFYKTDEVLTSLGIGEALVSALNEKGIPTPLAATLMRAPETRMDILSASEIDEIISRSNLVAKYNTAIDSKSAYEILEGKIDKSQEKEAQDKLKEEQDKARKATDRVRKEGSTMESLTKNTMVRQIGRTVFRELARGILGVLGVK
jgi:hypothetical protein